MAMLQRQAYVKPRKIIAKGDWELFHEDMDYFKPGLLLDHNLTDLDGSETHLSHQIGISAVNEIIKRKS